jgi:hypothetical protein
MLAGPAGILAGQAAIWISGGGGGLDLAFTLRFLGFWTFGAVIGSLVTGRGFGVTLTPSSARVHNLRRRDIPWSAVQAITIEKYLTARTIVLYDATGRRTRLRAPVTGFLAWDQQFEEKFHTIGQWWLAHRGPGWAPVWAPPSPQWRTVEN